MTFCGRLVPDSSEIGVFDSSGSLVGSGVVINGISAFPIWGQNSQDTVKDGCAPSEKITFKLVIGNWEYPLNYLPASGSATVVRYATNAIFQGSLSVPVCHPISCCGKGKIASLGVMSSSDNYSITQFDLTQVYPNPFKRSVNIAFDVPTIGGVSQHAIEIGVYDLKGCLVKQVAKGTYSSGHYEIAWNNSDTREAAAGSGVYIVRMKAANFDKRLKLVRVQ